MRIGIDPLSESEDCPKVQNIKAQRQKNWSFVIAMAIDKWQMIIDKFFRLGLMPCSTSDNCVNKR
jgi:hypothetical protein